VGETPVRGGEHRSACASYEMKNATKITTVGQVKPGRRANQTAEKKRNKTAQKTDQTASDGPAVRGNIDGRGTRIIPC